MIGKVIGGGLAGLVSLVLLASLAILIAPPPTRTTEAQ
jgi:hypothetical protein